MLQETCPCKRTNCPRHGDCTACREHHHASNRKPLTYCEKRERKKARRAQRSKNQGPLIAVAENENKIWRIDRLCYLFLIFLTGSLAGWIYEEIFYWITEGMLRNRGILYGPWLPIYGMGTLGIYAMKPVKKHPVLLFFLCTVITGVVEYIFGFVGIHLFGIRLWDYRGLFWNLDGIICLRSIMSFAVMGMVFHYLLEPAAERMVRKRNPKTVHTMCQVLLILFVVDCMLSALFRTPITY